MWNFPVMLLWNSDVATVERNAYARAGEIAYTRSGWTGAFWYWLRSPVMVVQQVFLGDLLHKPV